MHIVEIDQETLDKVTGPDEGNALYEGYFCIQTRPFECSCRIKPWTFIHYIKSVIVWAEKDDPNMLKCAGFFKKHDFDPRIIEYKPMMGKCLDWEDIPNGGDLFKDGH
jgi:hypothetical protein